MATYDRKMYKTIVFSRYFAFILDMLFYVLLLIIIARSTFADGTTINKCSSRPTKNTTTILADLRREMQNAGIGIYVIFTSDQLGSEFMQPYDKRRDWISGFRGSAGTAVVSEQIAALWTDNRYFTQAEEELDCANWLLMREGEPDVPTLIAWLVAESNRTALVRFYFCYHIRGFTNFLR
jgi:hypothetical protein